MVIWYAHLASYNVTVCVACHPFQLSPTSNQHKWDQQYMAIAHPEVLQSLIETNLLKSVGSGFNSHTSDAQDFLIRWMSNQFLFPYVRSFYVGWPRYMDIIVRFYFMCDNGYLIYSILRFVIVFIVWMIWIIVLNR